MTRPRVTFAKTAHSSAAYAEFSVNLNGELIGFLMRDLTREDTRYVTESAPASELLPDGIVLHPTVARSMIAVRRRVLSELNKETP